MQIREAVSADFGEVLRLYQQLQSDDPVLSNGRDLDVFNVILESAWLTIFVLIHDDCICATCYLNIIPNITRSARPYAIIENVITDEEHRGHGFGKVLIDEVLSTAWKQDCYKVMLQTGSKNEATHGFYRSCGFSGKEKTGYIARPD